MSTYLNNLCFCLLAEEKAMYSAELEKHKREKQEWRRRAETAEDKTAALQVSTGTQVSLSFTPICSVLCYINTFVYTG